MNSNSVIEGRNIQGRVFDETIELKDNAMLKARPDLFNEWDFEKNDEMGLDIYTITRGNRKKAWWICSSCGHSYYTRVAVRTRGCGCPCCNGKIIIIGFNDMWTTNPELASLLSNPEDGYKYTQSSGQKVEWNCHDCGGKSNKLIADTNKRGIRCVICSDGFSIPEKLMYNLLIQLKCKFKHDIQFEWSNTKRYDFYVPSLNMIIETHGGQHSGDGFKSMGGRTLQEEKENDKLKKETALANGIINYIEIDTRHSELDYLKKSILKSDFSKFFLLDDIDWLDIAEKSQKTLSKVACELWNNGNHNTKLISESLFLHERTIIRYLNFWSSIGKCDFNEYNFKERSVAQLSLNGDLIKTWSSIAEAIKNIDASLKSGNISKACQGTRNKVGGFKWMYVEDYEKYISTGVPPYPINKPHPNSKSVVKLNLNLELLKIYRTSREAIQDNNMNTVCAISNACTGKSKTAGGFKWMYLESYEDMLKESGELVS